MLDARRAVIILGKASNRSDSLAFGWSFPAHPGPLPQGEGNTGSARRAVGRAGLLPAVTICFGVRSCSFSFKGVHGRLGGVREGGLSFGVLESNFLR